MYRYDMTYYDMIIYNMMKYMYNVDWTLSLELILKDLEAFNV